MGPRSPRGLGRKKKETPVFSEERSVVGPDNKDRVVKGLLPGFRFKSEFYGTVIYQYLW